MSNTPQDYKNELLKASEAELESHLDKDRKMNLHRRRELILDRICDLALKHLGRICILALALAVFLLYMCFYGNDEQQAYAVHAVVFILGCCTRYIRSGQQQQYHHAQS